jgi:hypothetical protein
MRVPLKGIMDIEFPHRERDFVDLAESIRRCTPANWIADKMEIFEGDRS